MMKTILAVLCALTAVASAEERSTETPKLDGSYVSVGYEYATRETLGSSALFVDGGLRLGATPFSAHGRFTSGSAMYEDFQQARVGIEARGCVAQGLVCTFGGIDLGYERVTYNDRMTFNDPLAVPRAGLELGVPIRFRFSVEAPRGTDRTTGIAGSFSVGYSF